MSRKNLAVSEIIGTTILLAIAVTIFSGAYLIVFSEQPPQERPIVSIEADICQNNSIILSHKGGIDLNLNTQVKIYNGTNVQNFEIKDLLDLKSKSDNHWGIGEEIVYPVNDDKNESIKVRVIDGKTKSVIFDKVLKKGDKGFFPPYVDTYEPKNITLDSADVSLYYQLRNYTGKTRFKYRALGETDDKFTSWETVEKQGTCSCSLSGLNSGTEYLVQAQLRYNGELIKGLEKQFKTKTILDTHIEEINPYLIEDEDSIEIRAVADEQLDNVTLFYRYSKDNVTWTGNKYQKIGEVRKISNVGFSWKTINFWNTYSNPVVVCTNNLESKYDNEVCVRLSNVDSTSCRIRLQNPGDDHPVTSSTVYMIVVEEGVHTLSDGRKIEAYTYTESHTPDRSSNDNVGTDIGYSQSFEDPVVLAQIMSYDDPSWSVPLLTDGNVRDPPDKNNLYINRQIGEDSDIYRYAEEIGYIVIEAGEGTINNIAYEAKTTPDVIDGVFDDGHEYQLSDTFSLGVTSLLGQNGNNGGWSVLYSSNPISDKLHIAIDEDTIGDTERSHIGESVSYWVFKKSGNLTNDELAYHWMEEWDDTSNPDEDHVFKWDFDFPDGEGYYQFYSIGRKQGVGTEDPPLYENWDAICNYQEKYQKIGEVRKISNVGSSWKTINFWNTYSNPVIVCTNNLKSNSENEVCVRISNPTSNNCKIKLQNPGNDHSITAATVHMVIIEEGTHTLYDGRKIEAHRYLESETAGKNNWGEKGTSQSYMHSYSKPVVLGSIMSYNDPDWSVPFFTDGNTESPPDSDGLYTSKHVGEDTDVSRAPETIGYIVLEQGSGSLEELDYEAFVGEDKVDGTADNGYSYTLGDTYSVGIATQGGMDGHDGSWAVLYGDNPITSSITLACEEDTIGDTDRGHTTEQINYWVFSQESYITSNLKVEPDIESEDEDESD
ncbi:MAG: type IV pilin N-terminal domain-containing protein [Candidatus Thermoplasmatota archaeon]